MLEIIPDIKKIKEYQDMSEKHNLGYEYNDFFNPDILDDADELKERIKKYKDLNRAYHRDTIHGAFFDVVTFSYDKKIRQNSLDRMRQTVEIGEMLGCRGIVFHTNFCNEYMHHDIYMNRWLEYNIKAIEKLIADSSDIEIYYENMLDLSPTYILKLSENLKNQERYGVCLDIAHASLSKVPIEEWIQKLSLYIKHMHLNDNDMVYDRHMAIGDGVIDYKKILSIIKENKLDNVSKLIEVNGLDKIQKSLDMLKL